MFESQGSKLRICKLQMLRVSLPPTPRTSAFSPMPVTSGLSLRRYPAPATLFPVEHARMMSEDVEGRDDCAEALGIHIIARPSLGLPRTRFGGVRQADDLASAFNPGEWIIGDSHEYAPATGDIPVEMDEVCDEGVSTEILRVAGGMLRGAAALTLSRSGRGGTPPEHCRILSQWCGYYLDHTEGLLNLSCSVDSKGVASLTNAREGGNVCVVTGIGGKGMTMSPALGEEWVNQHFK